MKEYKSMFRLRSSPEMVRISTFHPLAWYAFLMLASMHHTTPDLFLGTPVGIVLYIVADKCRVVPHRSNIQ